MRVDENGLRQLHFVQALIVCDVLRRCFRVAGHVDEDVGCAGGDEVRSESPDQALNDVRQDARHAQGELEVSESVDEISGTSREADFRDDDADVWNDDEEDDE